MTFYHVISAILFFGAFRELLAAVNSGNILRISMSLTLALLVFNDALYTSWAIEQQRREYRPPLMFIDLTNFLILSAVLISMNSGRDSVFEVAVPRIGSWLPESRGWLLLGLYWLLIMLWTKMTGIYATPKYPKWLIFCSFGVAAGFVIQSRFAAHSTWCVEWVVTVLVTFYAFLYILVLRPLGLRKVSFSPPPPIVESGAPAGKG
ncbi:MAG: hypothetical protein ACHP8B_05510 [Terriglobales bacterium]